MKNFYFNEHTGDFLKGITAETFFRLKIDFDVLFDDLACSSFPLTSDLVKCYCSFQLAKTFKTRISIFYKI